MTRFCVEGLLVYFAVVQVLIIFLSAAVPGKDSSRCVSSKRNSRSYDGGSSIDRPRQLNKYGDTDYPDRVPSNKYAAEDYPDRASPKSPNRPSESRRRDDDDDDEEDDNDNKYQTSRHRPSRLEPTEEDASYDPEDEYSPATRYVNRTSRYSNNSHPRYNYTSPQKGENRDRDGEDKGWYSAGYGNPKESEKMREDKEEGCQLLTKSTKSSHKDVPTTTASAILSTPVGDFILYCTQHPPKTILSYPLYCDSHNGQSMGSDAVHTSIEHTCMDIRVVDDLNNLRNPRPFVIVLSRGENSAAYQVEYETKALRLLPCLHIFEYKYLTDMESVFLGDAGTLLAFSNDNPDPTAQYYEQTAPIYIAKDGSLTICGFADITNTQDVTSWRRGPGVIMLLYTQKRGKSKRFVMHLFELSLKKGFCHVRRYKAQPTIGAAMYDGARNTLCASEPYTLDQCLCGVADAQVLTAPARYTTAHLAVALSNPGLNDDNVGCPNEEMLNPYNSHDKGFCCCANANRHSFVIEYSKVTESFDFMRKSKTAFQNLNGRQSSVTEITQLETEKCCPVFQTISPVGETELYTMEYNSNGDLEVFLFVNHGLPPFAEKTTYGYCDDNDLIVSYTLNSFQGDNTIHHIRCNKEEEFIPEYRQYRPKYRFFNGLNRNNRSLTDRSPSYRNRTVIDDRYTNYRNRSSLENRYDGYRNRSYTDDRYNAAPRNRSRNDDPYSGYRNRSSIPDGRYQNEERPFLQGPEFQAGIVQRGPVAPAFPDTENGGRPYLSGVPLGRGNHSSTFTAQNRQSIYPAMNRTYGNELRRQGPPGPPYGPPSQQQPSMYNPFARI